MKYFSKVGPRTPILMPTGDPVKFDTLDGRVGYYATDNPVFVAAFEKSIAEGRGGLSVINKTVYDEEYVKKKASSPPYVAPTELPGIRPGQTGDTVGVRHTAPAHAAEAKPVTPVKVDTGKPAHPHAAHPHVGKRHSSKE